MLNDECYLCHRPVPPGQFLGIDLKVGTDLKGRLIDTDHPRFDESDGRVCVGSCHGMEKAKVGSSPPQSSPLFSLLLCHKVISLVAR